MAFPVPAPLLPANADDATRHWERWEASVATVNHHRQLNKSLTQPEIASFLRGVFGSSPYLAGLACRFPEEVGGLFCEGLEARLEALYAAPVEANDQAAVMADLRRRKGRLALLVGLADLAGWSTVEVTTEALSRFADWALQAAMRFLVRQLVEDGVLRPCGLEDSGIFALGMGKLGAGELNYSSDIDLILFYDPERLPFTDDEPPRARLLKFAQGLVTLMESRTADGYVFRVDLRLRPDPFSTPAIMSTLAGLTYYESVGQNWERAVYIKARTAAGDLDAGRAFLKELIPFVWRKHLDFAAITDIESIKRQIDHNHGEAEADLFGHNVKLGVGGIRDIELFTQTQQLIWGGKQPALRDQTTRGALKALADERIITAEAARDLTEAYRALRRVEHAIQMVEDQQTHSLPETEEEMQRVSALLGFANLASFRVYLHGVIAQVTGYCRPLFQEQKSLSAHLGDDGSQRLSLVFTGNDDDPDTVRTLTHLGYQDPSTIARLIRQWHSGHCRATRTAHARELLTELIPDILEAFATSGTPDEAFKRLDQFFHALPAGVQVLSLLSANPAMLPLMAAIFGSSPRLAEAVSKFPHMLDRVVSNLGNAMPSQQNIHDELQQMLRFARDREDALHIVRQLNNEYQLLIATQLLTGNLPIEQAGARFTQLADGMVGSVLAQVREDFEAQYGVPEQGACAILALGKWGGGQLSLDSDLDCVFVYEAEGPGDCELSPSTYYHRLAQRFMTAVTAQMKFGRLHDMDMRLRPFGNDGPMAVALPAFAAYYSGQGEQRKAWAYEYLALSRGRVACGDASLGERLQATVREALTQERNHAAFLKDIRALRQDIRRNLPPSGIWDVKRQPGGLLDLEMAQQALTVTHAAQHPSLLATHTVEALERLHEVGVLEDVAYQALHEAAVTLIHVQQILRLCRSAEQDEAGDGFPIVNQFRQLLAGLLGEHQRQDMERRLKTLYAASEKAIKLLLK